MKKILKDTKFWMYLPFAAIYGLKMSRWVFEPDNEIDRGWRYVFLLLNVVFSIVLSAIVGIVCRTWVV